MSPKLAPFDVADCLIGNSELSSDCGHRQFGVRDQLSNGLHIRIGQLCASVAHADRVPFLPMAIGVVLCFGASEQMVRIYARRVIALVKNTQACIKRSVRSFVHEAMNSGLSHVRVVNDPVAFAVSGAGPRPAVIGVWELRKALHHANFHRNGLHGCSACGVDALNGAENSVSFSHLAAAVTANAPRRHLSIIPQQLVRFGL